MNFSLFVVTVLIWGTTWFAITVELGPVPVLVSVFYRFALAALILFAILAATRRLVIPARRHHRYIAAQAFCLFCCNFICFYAATAYIPSGLVSVIFSLATLFNAVNARLIFGTPISGRMGLAAAMGIAGLVLLFGHDVAIAFTADTVKGIALATLGTLLFSLGNMASRRNSAAGVPPIIANTFGMAYGAAMLLLIIACTRTPFVLPPDESYLIALLYLSLFGSVIGFTTYLSLVARVGPSRAAYTTVLFPVVALAVSTIYEGDQWHATGVFGLGLAICGNLLIFSGTLTRPLNRAESVAGAEAR